MLPKVNVVLVLGFNESEIPETARRLLRHTFGPNAMFLRTDPRYSDDHLRDCRRLEAAGVVVPYPTPAGIPSPELAMQEGFIHVVLHGGNVHPFTPHEAVELPKRLRPK